MLSTISASQEHGHLMILIGREFTFDSVMDFRNSYKKQEGVRRVTVDMSKTQRIDSSALGMLIALWVHMGTDADTCSNETDSRQIREHTKVTLKINNDYICKILKVVGFEKKFTIERV